MVCYGEVLITKVIELITYCCITLLRRLSIDPPIHYGAQFVMHRLVGVINILPGRFNLKTDNKV